MSEMGYPWTASRLSIVETGLPAVLMVEISLRFPVSKSGYGTTAPKHLMRAAWDDAGYCLDAPVTLPAGGCEYMQIDEDAGLPVQLTFMRDTEGA